jgi:hypothetical protein
VSALGFIVLNVHQGIIFFIVFKFNFAFILFQAKERTEQKIQEIEKRAEEKFHKLRIESMHR